MIKNIGISVVYSSTFFIVLLYIFLIRLYNVLETIGVMKWVHSMKPWLESFTFLLIPYSKIDDHQVEPHNYITEIIYSGNVSKYEIYLSILLYVFEQ